MGEGKAVVIGGKEVDPSEVVPLKVRDWRKLQGFGIKVDGLHAGDVETIARFVYWCAHECNEEITRGDIDDLELLDLIQLCNIFFPSRSEDENFT